MLVSIGACEGEEDDAAPRCIEIDVDECTPQYAPLFDRVFAETLSPSCGVPGAACHGTDDAAGAARGLHISDADASYATLLGHGSGVEFVIPGDPNCSPLMVRMNTSDTSLLMPPGQQPLRESVRCSIARWIAEGADR